MNKSLTSKFSIVSGAAFLIGYIKNDTNLFSSTLISSQALVDNQISI